MKDYKETPKGSTTFADHTMAYPYLGLETG